MPLKLSPCLGMRLVSLCRVVSPPAPPEKSAPARSAAPPSALLRDTRLPWSAQALCSLLCTPPRGILPLLVVPHLSVRVWIGNVPQRLLMGWVGPQLVTLVGGGRKFRRWGLVGRGGSLGICL